MPNPKLAKPDYPRAPHKTDKMWWYEESDGIYIYRDPIGYVGRIRWQSIIAAVKRHERIRQAKKEAPDAS